MTDIDEDDIKKSLHSMLICFREGLPANKIQSDFRMLMGYPIPFHKLGFPNLENYLRSIPTVVKLKDSEHGLLVQAVPSKNTEHISELVARQKSSKTNRNNLRNFRTPVRPLQKPTQQSFRPQSAAPRFQRSNSVTGQSNQKSYSPGFQQNRPKSGSFEISENKGRTAVATQNHSNFQSIRPPPSNDFDKNWSKPSTKQIRTGTSQPNIQKTSNLPANGRPLSSTQVDRTISPDEENTRSSLSTSIRSPSPKITESSSSFKNAPNRHFSRLLNSPTTTTQGERTVKCSSEETSYKTTLEKYCKLHKLEPPVFNTVYIRNGVTATARVNGDRFSSYPAETENPDEAVEIAAKNAVETLGLHSEKGKRTISLDIAVIFQRLREILSEFPTGIFHNELPKEYAKKYNEDLPKGWLDSIVENKIAERTRVDSTRDILYPVSASSVSETQKEGQNNNLPVNISEIILPESKTWDVFVSHAVSTKNIYIRLVDSSEQFEELGVRMHETYRNSQPLRTKIQVGELFATEQADSWHRVEVISVIDDKVLCLFIDNGDCEFISCSNLRTLKPEFLPESVPKQAISCELSGLEEYAEHPSALINLDLILGETYVAEIVSQEDRVSLVLFDTTDEKAENINEKLKSLILAEDITPRFPQVGQVIEVLLSHVEPNGDLYVQIIGKCAAFVEYLLKVMRETCGENPPVENVKLKTMYLAKYSGDGEWYRARTEIFVGKDKVKIIFVDFGNAEVVSIADLRDLLNEILSNLPPLALRCKLFAIPPSEDLEWSPEVMEHITELAMNQHILLRVVMPVTDETSIAAVDMFKRIQPENTLTSINGSLAIQGGFRKKPTENATSSQDELLSQPPLPGIGAFFDVHVSLAPSPSNFMCKPWKTIHVLEDLTLRMQNYYGNPQNLNEVLPSTIKEGNYYACVHKSDFMWYRVQVKGFDSTGSVLSVYYIDFGDTEIANANELQPLPKDFQNLPRQAIFCSLADVIPTNVDWSTQDCIHFRTLVEEKEFVAQILSKCQDLNGNLIVGMKLFDTSHPDEDRIIGDVLIAEGRALPSLKVFGI